jgi:HTH-type transcriptional regulator/antitoxin HigA
MNQISPIRTEADHRAALAEVERLVEFDPKPGTPDGDRLSVLAILVQSYERVRFPLDRPSPIEAIQFRMTELGLRQKDLVPMIGSKSKVSEVLSGRRPLSLNMIRALSSELNIPVDLLVAKDGEVGKPLRRSAAH